MPQIVVAASLADMSYYQYPGTYPNQYQQYEQPQVSGPMAGMSAQGTYTDTDYSQPLSSGFFAAFGVSGYPGEPSLLKEIGINFSHIAQKTRAVLHPFAKIDQNIMDDADLAGPIIFILLFGFFLLLTGKPHFGYIYGIGLLGTFWQYILLNLMGLKSIAFMSTMSVLGYCVLPLVAISGLGVFADLDNSLGYALGTLAIVWCTWASSAMFVAYLQLSEMRALVAYPTALFYSIFSLMSIFADSSLAAAAP